ncbi:hypothetical protein N3K66_002532 [Trichothecium roseum]|uniref:Uncharacterized protein n=1 Tax=Trichothecium roseum TaxID=47278 RepID=A0ACC0VBI0_9HYPO|nr:hypothetical protein N3K66_002532 [Trichothecium roseum]
MAASLAGKHCAVVGGTGVIGASIARAFAWRGAVTSVLGRRALQLRGEIEPLLRPYEPLPPPSPWHHRPELSRHRFIKLDVSQRESIKDVFASEITETSVGPVDILVNCAGISQTTLLKRTPDAEVSKIVDTNLLATMLVSKHAKMRPHGCIINVSSLMATKGAIGATAYAASKAGVVGFTRALCLEMSARSIRVNALLPGWVQSEMWENLKQDLKDSYLKDTPLGRVATPEEVAEAVIFLAANEFANNCVLNLDGGLSAS